MKPELFTTEAVPDSGRNAVCTLPAVQPSGRLISFGVFELDGALAQNLRKQGVKVKLQDQPFQILQVLLERPGEVVTREELQGVSGLPTLSSMSTRACTTRSRNCANP